MSTTLSRTGTDLPESGVVAPGAALVAARQSAPAALWQLDPSLVFLNHGSYGAVLRTVLSAQSEYRDRFERDPVRFLKVDLEGLMDGVREHVAGFMNCRAADLAPFRNATDALCTIIANTRFEPGDELLITDHEYQSVHNELERLAARAGVRVVKAAIPFPIQSPEQVVERVLACITPRTKLGLISHITSASSLIFPVKPIVDEFNRRGIDIIVDGAHSPGQIPVDLGAMAPTYFVGSGHKWLSAPKGTAFLYVRSDKQPGFRPMALTGRAHKIRPDRALFLRDFDYHGTDDYTALLALPDAIDEMGSLLSGGWPALMRHNHDLAMLGRRIVAKAIGVDLPAPESMVGTMATLILPEPAAELLDRVSEYDDALQDELYHRHKCIVPVWRLGAGNLRVVRLSAQLYNTPEQYEVLGAALAEELGRERAYRAVG